MSKQKTAERKFNAQRRLAHGGDKIPFHPKVFSSKPSLQSNGFFSTTKNFFLKMGASLLPDESTMRSPLSAVKSSSISSLMIAMVSFLPRISAEGIKYFSINGSHYAVLPEGNVDWIDGSCGAIMESSGIAGDKIMSLCTLGGDSDDPYPECPVYAGLNTTASMTSALKCLQELGQKRCDDYVNSLRLALGLGMGIPMLCICCYVCFRGSSCRSSRISVADEASLHEPYNQLRSDASSVSINPIQEAPSQVDEIEWADEIKNS